MGFGNLLFVNSFVCSQAYCEFEDESNRAVGAAGDELRIQKFLRKKIDSKKVTTLRLLTFSCSLTKSSYALGQPISRRQNIRSFFRKYTCSNFQVPSGEMISILI